MSKWTLALSASAAVAAAACRADTQLIEAEDFQFHGGWARIRDSACLGAELLQAFPAPTSSGPSDDAVTAFRIGTGGDYAIWVRARDFASDRPGTRRFAVAVDGAPLAAEAGNHGGDGFAWQLLGSRHLPAGEHLLALRDTTHGFGRCDALFLTSGTNSPAAMLPRQLAQQRVRPVTMRADEPLAFRPVAVCADAGEPLATLESDTLRLAFRAGRDPQGRPWILRSVSVRAESGWRDIPDDGSQEALFLLRTPRVTADLLRTGSWMGARVPVEAEAGGVRVRTCASASDPYTAAPAARLAPREVTAHDAASVEITYRSDDGFAVPVRWSLDPDDPYTLRARALLTASTPGFYSLGFSPHHETSRDDVQFVQLPPLYQFQRLPTAPDLLCNTLTPHPAALAQTPWLTNGPPLSIAVVAEPENLPFVWPDATNAVCGFSLLNSRNAVQPTIFMPVLGSPRSKLAADEARAVSWRVTTRPSDWKATLESLILNVLKVSDYREPVNASLTDAALNMLDLMQDDVHGGWNSELRGFYDIESATMGKQAAPLALLSASTISRSETLWKTRALPTLEFLLSRRRSDIIQSGTTRDGKPALGQLAVPSEFYGASCWEGAARLTLNLNPWLEAFAFDTKGKTRYAQAYNASWPWTERLAASRLRSSKELLSEACANADVWLAKEVYARQTKPVDYSFFYNIHFYPYWWDLMDLHEATRDARYLHAAEECAFHTIAGLWSHPRVPAGEVVVHPGGSQETYHPIWHKNDQLFRLGWPRQANDTPEHRVPAWQVSPVGLGLEQPSTYTCFRGAMNNIMQSTWAPHLLRLYRCTGREIYRTCARNSVIGRFANYPGYYLTCFTDRVQDPRYPYAGPDITSLYYHHIPVHYAFTLDYLVSDAELRSGGHIAFPWVKQKNYAWFNSRVYTAQPGRVYGDTNAVLWIERDLVRLDTPKADWLAARSPNHFWVTILNQTRATNTVAATIDVAKAGVLPYERGTVYVGNADPHLAGERTAPGAELPELRSGRVVVTIAPLSSVTLRYPAQRRDEFPAAAPLTQSHRSAQAGDFGTAHAFTIRSPWGKDAIYAVLTSDAKPGAKVKFRCGAESQVCERFPYEASFYPAPDPAAPVYIDAVAASGASRTICLQ